MTDHISGKTSLKVHPIKLKLIKETFITLADEHRKSCKGENCNVSLMWLADVLIYLNVDLTADELRHFI